jgi:hypothetical protein
MAQLLGFVPIANLSGHVKDADGTSRDLIILALDARDAVTDESSIL